MSHQQGKTAVIYRRVSTTDQKDKGHSLPEQKDALHRFCEVSGIQVLKDFEEDHSAKNFSRPVFADLLSFVAIC